LNVVQAVYELRRAVDIVAFVICLDSLSAVCISLRHRVLFVYVVGLEY